MENAVKENEISIFGVIAVPENIDADTFETEFIQWVESKGYKFGGGIAPFIDLP